MDRVNSKGGLLIILLWSEEECTRMVYIALDYVINW